MHFNSTQTNHDPNVKELLTRLDHHTRQVEAAERSKAHAAALLTAPPVNEQSHANARALIAAAEGQIAANQSDVDSTAAALVSMGVALANEQARKVSPVPVKKAAHRA